MVNVDEYRLRLETPMLDASLEQSFHVASLMLNGAVACLSIESVNFFR